jgi:hypothetical protein
MMGRIMTRTLASLDLVQLPKLDTTSAQTLGTEVLAAAKGKNLASNVSDALDEFATAHRALQAAAAQRLPTTTSADPARAKTADANLDLTWSALFDFLTGWSKLPDHENASIANNLLSHVVPEGLKFILLAYKLEWAESNTRLLLIKDRKLDAEVDKLGGGPILRRLREAHKEYGDALGVTSATKAVIANANLREVLDEFSAALRQYIVCVAASVRKKDAKTAALADALLAPVQSWTTPGGQSSKAPDAPLEPPPAPSPSGPSA